MRIIELNNLGVRTPVAKVFQSLDNKLYFNYKVGLRYKDCKEYTLSFSNKDYSPTSKDDILILDKDNYNVVPVYKNGELAKDRNNNQIYTVREDNTVSHRSNSLVIWELPNNDYVDVTYQLDGSVSKLADASSGVYRNDTMYVTQILILSVYGDCVLTASFKDSEGKSYTKSYTYNYKADKWDIGEIKREGV